ncbi:hypothetical protein [Synechococcus sp. ROS8604]|uniref:hypothetical protein n=1 Tax=Synechococcus sp. ROS8604 TaxID=1442557 RepID=UPI002103E540|nr:hypothetical protein [Synechococcus sp. ROS8604]
MASAPEVQKLQDDRQRYLGYLANGDPVQTVIDTLDQQIAALLEAGSSEGGHLLELRAWALRRQRVIGVFPPGGGEMVPTSEVEVTSEEQAVATALRQSWERNARSAAINGEAGIGPGIWQEIRDLLREAVVEDKRLVRIELNL